MIRVLIVDDSALVRQVLTEILQPLCDIEVVGSAPDPFVARERIKQLHPDVLTLDVEMPRMDGVTFLRNLMRLRPMPVVMVSSLTEQGAEVTLQALEYGAVDFIAKPKLDVAHGLRGYADELVEKIRTAARTKVSALAARLPNVSEKARATPVVHHTTDKIIAIGASTGGTEAIKHVLAMLPATAPGIVITQHIPAAFSESFAKRLDGLSPLTVSQARDGQQILDGHAYVAPGSRHLSVQRDGAHYVCRIEDGPPVNRHKPSVDVMFDSVARAVGPNGVSVLLTGMGEDGARGMLAMKQAGAPTLAQDEATSVVWGMPGEACKRGAVDELVPLSKMAERIMGQLATL